MKTFWRVAISNKIVRIYAFLNTHLACYLYTTALECHDNNASPTLFRYSNTCHGCSKMLKNTILLTDA